MVDTDTLYRLQRKASLMKAHAATTARATPEFKGTGMCGRSPFNGMRSRYSSGLLEAIEGALLGDARLQLQYGGKNCYLVINQSPEHMDALCAAWKVLREMEPGLRPPYLAGARQARLVTRVHPLLIRFFRRWYLLSDSYKGGRPRRREQRKVIPKDVIVTPAVMFWEYLWDGSLEENHGYYDVRLSTGCFEQPELEFLAERMYEESGITFKLRYVKGYPQLDLLGGTESVLVFLNYVLLSGCAIPECFLYKFKAIHAKSRIPSW